MASQIEMENNQLSDNIERTLLELHFNKHLQYQTNSLIAIFTFIIGIIIALATKEIKFSDYFQMAVVGFFAIIILTPSAYYFINSKKHLKRIPEEMKKLKL